ncbi:MAG: biopolymer transporter ExbD [Acidobacteriaceae bacterium]|nr:biopolymer transporter ExbD [Acidobacteriaceae bacterium]
MAIAVRNEGAKVNSNINVTPMVDVMLVLLIIFMVITPMLENRVNVTLAQTENAVAMEDASKEDAVTIAITRDSKVFLGQDQVTIADLGPKVADLLQNKTSKMVYFRSDARAHYGTVMDAIDAVRTTGVDEIGLLTENRAPNKPPTAGE